MTTRPLSRSDNTHQTLQRPQEGHASRGATSSTSTPNSPNYFDPPSEEADLPGTVYQPAARPQNTGKVIHFAGLPHANIVQKTPDMTKIRPLDR